VKSFVSPVLMLLLAVGLQVGCDKSHLPFFDQKKLTFSGAVEQQEVRVGSKSGGRVREVLVREGDHVESGQPLVSFETTELDALLAQAIARVEQQRVRLEKLEAGAREEEKAQARANTSATRAAFEAVRNWPRSEEVGQAEAALAMAQADQALARATAERMQRLRRTGDVSQQEDDSARFRLEQLTARVEAERRRLELLRRGSRSEEIQQAEERYRQASAAERLIIAGPRREEIAEARSQLDEARARLDQIRVQRNEATVTAPSRAVVEVLPLRPGDLLIPNQIVARLLEDDQVWVRIFVPEPQLGLIRVGDGVEIRIDSFSERVFGGTIAQINSQGEFNPRNVQSRDERNHLVFGVKVRVDNRDQILKSGMAAEVKVAGSQ